MYNLKKGSASLSEIKAIKSGGNLNFYNSHHVPVATKLGDYSNKTPNVTKQRNSLATYAYRVSNISKVHCKNLS